MTGTLNFRQRAQAKLYGETAKPATTAAAALPDKFARHAKRAATLYGSSYGRAVDSLIGRFVARHADDPDLVRFARSSGPLLHEFMAKRGMSETDAVTFTVGLLERDKFPRDESAKQQLNERNYEAFRKESGGFEGAAPGIENHKRFCDDFCNEVPFFGARARDQGANLDLDQVRIGARYGAPPK